MFLKDEPTSSNQISGSNIQAQEAVDELRLPSLPRLKDSWGREFKYLRLSITDVCNFKCNYCLPNGYQKPDLHEAPLSLDEILVLAKVFAKMGVVKFRITGGEPTTRSDIVEIIRGIKRISGVEQVALSTNGYRLKKLGPLLIGAGLDALNISLDSLDPDRFKAITSSAIGPELKESVEKLVGLGSLKVKVNAVLLKQSALEDFELFLQWVRDVPVSVRFIELMETGAHKAYYQKNHVSGGMIQFELQKRGWKPLLKKSTDGPALEYQHPDFAGKMGLIAPYSKDFCDSCNRLRVTSAGALKLCLFGSGEFSLREYLSTPNQLASRVLGLLGQKDHAHRLHEGDPGNTQNLSTMGG